MIHPLSYFTSIFVFSLILLCLTGGASADCKRFTVSDKPYYKSGKHQQVSDYVRCQPNDKPHKPRNCKADSGNPGVPGCLVKGEGKVTAHGYTNLTLPLSESQFLFQLASKATKKFFNVEKHLHTSMAACVDQEHIHACISPRRAMYIGFNPRLLCMDGTVEECDGSSNVKNGTGIHICGAVQSHSSLMGTKRRPKGGFLFVGFDISQHPGLPKQNPALENSNSVCRQSSEPSSEPNHNSGPTYSRKYFSWMGLLSAGLISFIFV